jgi:hypothetical protein
MDINKFTHAAGDAKCKEALEKFLEDFLSPAFGAMPKGEIELAVLNLLISIGAVKDNPSSYDLASILKITKTKARTLIYNKELRTRTSEELDAEVRKILLNPVIQKRGDQFALEVESPLTLDHLRAKVQKLGHLTDGSFSANLVTLNLDAMAALIESVLSQNQKNEAKKSLKAAGAANASVSGLLKATLKKIGKKIADDTGEEVINKAYEYMQPILDGAFEKSEELFKSLFIEKNNGQ